MKKNLVEFIGTFFLVSAALLGGGPAAAATLVVMVYAGAHISGANYNPAVSLGLVIRGKLDVADMIAYWVCQFVAAICAAFLVTHLKGPGSVTTFHLTHALVAEVLGTFALVFVVLNVATAKANAGNSYFGLAIGGTVLGMALAFGSFSGGAFNPAVALGVALYNNDWNHLWIYLVGCFGGGVLAAITFNFLNEE